MNIIIKEIKAICHSPEKAESYLKSSGAEFVGLDHQVDTYFNVPIGRLKLRQGNVECNLIQYNRTEVKNIKDSQVSLFKPLSDADGLKVVLERSLGIKTVVDKRRKIFFINNVKFHIDEVKGLGHFLEIEAIGEKNVSDEDELTRQCKFYMDELGVSEKDLIDKSYSDLILELR